MVARKYVSLNIEYPPLPRAFLKILKMANMSPTEPAIHLTKVTMTTILSQRKAGPRKRDIEKTKGTDGNCEEELPKKPVGRLSVNCRPTGYRQSTDS